jgi:hypothetical protein
MLDGETERVFPVVEDLSAEHVTADAPVVTILIGGLQVVVSYHEIVEIGDLPRSVSELHLAGLEDE